MLSARGGMEGKTQGAETEGGGVFLHKRVGTAVNIVAVRSDSEIRDGAVATPE